MQSAVTPITEEGLGNADPPLAQPLAQNSAADAGLDRLIAAWPSLAEPIRRAVLALVEAND